VDRIRADVDGRYAHGSTIINGSIVQERSQLLKKRLSRLSQTFKAAEKGDVIALHRARVASRRLRELLPLLELPASRGRKIRRRLRKVTARLGSVRELDVLMLLIDELHVSRRAHRLALGRLAIAVSKRRDGARKHLTHRLPRTEVRRATRKLKRILDGLRKGEEESSSKPKRAWRWALDARIVRRATRLQAAMEHAGALYLPDRLHTVRLAVKKLRYTLELASEVASSETTTADLRLLRRTQDLLGRLHDAELLIEHCRREQAAISPPNLELWQGLDALIIALEDDARRFHARYCRLAAELTPITERLTGRRKGQATHTTTRRVS
jgi:CHAD domain-containing protein